MQWLLIALLPLLEHGIARKLHSRSSNYISKQTTTENPLTFSLADCFLHCRQFSNKKRPLEISQSSCTAFHRRIQLVTTANGKTGVRAPRPVVVVCNRVIAFSKSPAIWAMRRANVWRRMRHINRAMSTCVVVVNVCFLCLLRL